MRRDDTGADDLQVGRVWGDDLWGDDLPGSPLTDPPAPRGPGRTGAVVAVVLLIVAGSVLQSRTIDRPPLPDVGPDPTSTETLAPLETVQTELARFPDSITLVSDESGWTPIPLPDAGPERGPRDVVITEFDDTLVALDGLHRAWLLDHSSAEWTVLPELRAPLAGDSRIALPIGDQLVVHDVVRRGVAREDDNMVARAARRLVDGAWQPVPPRPGGVGFGVVDGQVLLTESPTLNPSRGPGPSLWDGQATTVLPPVPVLLNPAWAADTADGFVIGGTDPGTAATGSLFSDVIAWSEFSGTWTVLPPSPVEIDGDNKVVWVPGPGAEGRMVAVGDAQTLGGAALAILDLSEGAEGSWRVVDLLRPAPDDLRRERLELALTDTPDGSMLIHASGGPIEDLLRIDPSGASTSLRIPSIDTQDEVRLLVQDDRLLLWELATATRPDRLWSRPLEG